MPPLEQMSDGSKDDINDNRQENKQLQVFEDSSVTPPVSGNGSSGDKARGKPQRPDGKIELQESDCYDKLGF
ncbi:MAG: hypothetical protein M1830_006637, partial [Pleopsidium flavum]